MRIWINNVEANMVEDVVVVRLRSWFVSVCFFSAST